MGLQLRGGPVRVAEKADKFVVRAAIEPLSDVSHYGGHGTS